MVIFMILDYRNIRIYYVILRYYFAKIHFYFMVFQTDSGNPRTTGA